jgi:hypothetical protein
MQAQTPLFGAHRRDNWWVRVIERLYQDRFGAGAVSPMMQSVSASVAPEVISTSVSGSKSRS